MNTFNTAPRFPTTDPLEQMAREDHDDWVLLRLVVCVAVATLAMAVASTLPM
jgi:hypothetical protein